MNISPGLTATITALRDILQEAATVSQEAHAALAERHRNIAIGTLLSLEDELPTATALLQAALALHRGDP